MEVLDISYGGGSEKGGTPTDRTLVSNVPDDERIYSHVTTSILGLIDEANAATPDAPQNWSRVMGEVVDTLGQHLLSYVHWLGTAPSQNTHLSQHPRLVDNPSALRHVGTGYVEGDLNGALWPRELTGLAKAIGLLVHSGFSFEASQATPPDRDTPSRTVGSACRLFGLVLKANERYLAHSPEPGLDRALFSFWTRVSYSNLFPCLLSHVGSERGKRDLTVLTMGSPAFLGYILYGTPDLGGGVPDTTCYATMMDHFGRMLTATGRALSSFPDPFDDSYGRSLSLLLYALEFYHSAKALGDAIDALASPRIKPLGSEARKKLGLAVDHVGCMTWLLGRIHRTDPTAATDHDDGDHAETISAAHVNILAERHTLDSLCLMATYARNFLPVDQIEPDGKPGSDPLPTKTADTVVAAVRGLYLGSNEGIALLARSPQTTMDLVEALVAVSRSRQPPGLAANCELGAMQIYFTLYAFHCTSLLLHHAKLPSAKVAQDETYAALKTLLALVTYDPVSRDNEFAGDRDVTLSQLATVSVLARADNFDCCLPPLFEAGKSDVTNPSVVGMAEGVLWSSLHQGLRNDYLIHGKCFIRRMAHAISNAALKPAVRGDTPRLFSYVKAIFGPKQSHSLPKLVPSIPAIHECLKQETESLKVVAHGNSRRHSQPPFLNQCVILMVLLEEMNDNFVSHNRASVTEDELSGVLKSFDVFLDIIKWATRQLNVVNSPPHKATAKPTATPKPTHVPIYTLLSLIKLTVSGLRHQVQIALPTPPSLGDTSGGSPIEVAPFAAVVPVLLESYLLLDRLGNGLKQHHSPGRYKALKDLAQGEIYDCVAACASQSHASLCRGPSPDPDAWSLLLADLVTRAQHEATTGSEHKSATSPLLSTLKLLGSLLPLKLPILHRHALRPKGMSGMRERLLAKRRAWGAPLSHVIKPMVQLFVTLFWESGHKSSEGLAAEIFVKACDTSPTFGSELVRRLLASHTALVDRPEWEEAFDDPLQAGAIIDWLLAFKRVLTVLNQLIEHPCVKASFLHPLDPRTIPGGSHQHRRPPTPQPLGPLYVRQVLEILYNPWIREPVNYRSTESSLESARRTKHPLLDSIDREGSHFLATLLDPLISLNHTHLTNPGSRSDPRPATLKQVLYIMYPTLRMTLCLDRERFTQPQDLQLIAKTYVQLPARVKKRLTPNNLDESYAKLRDGLVAITTLTTNDITFANLKYTVEAIQPRVFLDVLDVSYSMISKTTPLGAIETIGVCLDFFNGILLCDMSATAHSANGHRTLRYGLSRFKSQIHWGKQGVKHPLVSMKIFLMELTTNPDYKVKNLATQLLESINLFITFLNKDLTSPTSVKREKENDKDYLEIVKEFRPDPWINSMKNVPFFSL